MTRRHTLLSMLTLSALATAITLMPGSQSSAQESPRRPRPDSGQNEPQAPERIRRDGAGREGAGREGGRPDRAQNVEAQMKTMNRSLKRLLAQIGNESQKEANLKLLDDAQRGCVTAKSLPPPKEVLKDATTDQAKTKAALHYREDMLAVLRKLIDAEEALLDGKSDQAKAALDEVIRMRDREHKKLGIEDHDDDK